MSALWAEAVTRGIRMATPLAHEFLLERLATHSTDLHSSTILRLAVRALHDGSPTPQESSKNTTYGSNSYKNSSFSKKESIPAGLHFMAYRAMLRNYVALDKYPMS